MDLVLTCGISLGMILLLVEGHQQAEHALRESLQRSQEVAEENVALQAEIRKRHDAELALRRRGQARRRLRLSPCSMSITTLRDGSFLEVNESFERLTAVAMKSWDAARSTWDCGSIPQRAQRC
jgi:PAS domain-containing protein